MNRYARLLGIAAAASLSVGLALAAPPVGTDPERFVWGGAAEGSSYTDNYVPQVVDVLNTKARMKGYGWGGPTLGTVENAAIITNTPTNLAVGQYDILKDLQGQPIPGDATGKLYDFTFILGADGTPANLGPECLYIVTSIPGYTDSSAFGNVLADAWDMTLATGAEGSGSLATFKRLQSIYPDLTPDSIINAGGALKIVEAVASGQATHGFFVQRPDPASPVFEAIKNAKLTIVPVVDSALEGEYTFNELKVANGGLFTGAKTVATACTFVALITGNPDTNPTNKRIKETVTRLSNAVTSEPNVLRPNLATWRDMFDNMKTLGGEKLQALLKASAEAINEGVNAAGEALDKTVNN